MSKITAAGAHSMYIGRLSGDDLAPSFGAAARLLKEQYNALLIGVHDDQSGRDRVNPPDNAPLGPTTRLIYLAEHAVLPEA